jgi:nucleotide-binding universal stress UspA family protein
MRSILVYADRSPSMRARLETGLSLARISRGHVTVLIDTPISRYISTDPMGISYLASDAMKAALADDDAHNQAIEAQLSSQDVPFDVLRSEAEPLDALISASRLADVVVLSRSSAIVGELALSAHTPVLVLPDTDELTPPLNCACIAWDGGNEAAAALRGAIPLLSGCNSVHLLTVQEKPGGFPSTDAMRYLSRHGVSAEMSELVRSGSTEETLAKAMARIGCQLLVMGAYGKSRMYEYLFGGVTRYFLEKNGSAALLLAH